MLHRNSPLAVLRTSSRVGASLVVILGAAVLLGWLLDVPSLKGVMPGLVTMKLNTAICFIFAGGALLLAQGEPAKRRRVLALTLAAVVLFVGLVTLGEYLTGADWGIDQLLGRDDLQAIGTSQPGRMAPTTALAFTFIGLALLASRRPAASGRLPRWLTVPPLLIATFALVGYSYHVSLLYAVQPYSSMAFHTAVGLLLLSLSVVAALPADWFVAVLVSDTGGGSTGRRLLPATAMLLFLLGWLGLAGQRAGLYDPYSGLALTVVAAIVVMGALVAWQAKLVHDGDVLRRGAEAQIVALNESLERRVDERTSELREALAQVRQLTGLLPICAWCKRIRDDQDYWHSVEGYITSHSEARFTHGVCPECQGRLLRDELPSN